MKKARLKGMALLMSVCLLTGCATLDKAKKADRLNYEVATLNRKIEKIRKEREAEIERLKREHQEALQRLQDEKQQEVKKIEQVKERELSDLEKAKLELEKRLSAEIGNYKAKLQMTERGLVVTFLSEIFFDSGKDNIKPDGEATLKKMADVLKKEVVDSNAVVEGHTDNDPIKHSGWRSNWELSSARSLAVVHFLIDQGGVPPSRLSAAGCGEYRPISSNETLEGRQQNRRVEIVILPSSLKKVK